MCSAGYLDLKLPFVEIGVLSHLTRAFVLSRGQVNRLGRIGNPPSFGRVTFGALLPFELDLKPEDRKVSSEIIGVTRGEDDEGDGMTVVRSSFDALERDERGLAPTDDRNDGG